MNGGTPHRFNLAILISEWASARLLSSLEEASDNSLRLAGNTAHVNLLQLILAVHTITSSQPINCPNAEHLSRPPCPVDASVRLLLHLVTSWQACRTATAGAAQHKQNLVFRAIRLTA
jgi:hypothetical protein